MQQAATALVVTVLVLLALLAVATSAIATTLKRRHPEVWAAEGHPEQWIWLTTTPPGRHIFNFLDERRYRATGDLRFGWFCAAVRLGWYAFFALFVAAVAILATELLVGQA